MGHDISDPIGMGREAYLETLDALRGRFRACSPSSTKLSTNIPPRPRPTRPRHEPARAASPSRPPPPSTVASRQNCRRRDSARCGPRWCGAEGRAGRPSPQGRTTPSRMSGTHGKDSVDYPDFVPGGVVEGVLADPASRGVLICTTGIGMSIAANRTPGIQAALVHDPGDRPRQPEPQCRQRPLPVRLDHPTGNRHRHPRRVPRPPTSRAVATRAGSGS